MCIYHYEYDLFHKCCGNKVENPFSYWTACAFMCDDSDAIVEEPCDKSDPTLHYEETVYPNDAICPACAANAAPVSKDNSCEPPTPESTPKENGEAKDATMEGVSCAMAACSVDATLVVPESEQLYELLSPVSIPEDSDLEEGEIKEDNLEEGEIQDSSPPTPAWNLPKGPKNWIGPPPAWARNPNNNKRRARQSKKRVGAKSSRGPREPHHRIQKSTPRPRYGAGTHFRSGRGRGSSSKHAGGSSPKTGPRDLLQGMGRGGIQKARPRPARKWSPSGREARRLLGEARRREADVCKRKVAEGREGGEEGMDLS